jgi:hypothetical protein
MFSVRPGAVYQIVSPDPYRANAFAAAKDALDHFTASLEFLGRRWGGRRNVSAKQDHGLGLVVD